MAAVLKRVVDDCRVDIQHHRKAMAYAASRDRAWPFSFTNLCEALDLDAASLREALLNGRCSMTDLVRQPDPHHDMLGRKSA